MRRYTVADAGKITKLVRQSWDDISDDAWDFSRLGEHVFGITTSPAIYLVGDNPTKMMVSFFSMSSNTAQIHIVFSKGEKNLVLRARSAVGWIFDNTPITALMAFAPTRKTQVFASMCGMHRMGVFPRSFSKNGLRDTVVFQCTDEDYRGLQNG